MLDPTTEAIEEAIRRAWSDSTAPETDKTPAIRKSAIDDLRDGGTLSRNLPGYRERPAQIEMTTLVEQAISEKKHALLEASTGTGKSLSYLIPLIRSKEKGVVSTANKALQEQLFYKDVPFCQEHIEPFGAVLLKGKGNYLCLQRLEYEANEGLQVHVQDLTFKKIEKATTDPSWNGDFEALPFIVPAEIRARIHVDEDDCARRKCPLYKDCYYYKMREQARHAQVIITNHDVLLLDAFTGFKMLPSHDITIVDEAHVLENVATKQFTIEIRPSRILSLLSIKRVKTYTKVETQDQAREQAERLWAHLSTLMPASGTRTALVEQISQGLTLAKTIEKLSNQLLANKPESLTAEEGELYDRTISRADVLARNLHAVFALEDKRYTYYLETERNQITASRTPLDVAPTLRDTLFSHGPVIATSATLSTPAHDPKTGEKATFDYFQTQTGMDDPNAITRILPMVFNYRKNALLYIPKDLPEPAYDNTPAAAAYEQAIAERMRDLAIASAGRAFLLFSSRHILNTVLGLIGTDLESNGHTLLVQGELPTIQLLKEFRTSPQAVLFGLKTFWEGVDVAGEALSLVVIDKLPFPAKNDPVVRAKQEYIKSTGQNDFTTYSLPQITLALKQGVGRLIRSDSDEGVMAILDTRLHTKFYGKSILSCLPPATQVITFGYVQSFFSNIREDVQRFILLRKVIASKGLDKHTYQRGMTNGEIIQKMNEIICNQQRSKREAEWLRQGLIAIMEKSQQGA
jgi:ATP-dependent DNA helicase DinG